MTSSTNSSFPIINDLEITPSEFWRYVQERRDMNEVLAALDGRPDLLSHFTLYVSLNLTIDRLERMTSRTRTTMRETFNDLANDDFIYRTSPFVHRQHRRFHPYQRPNRPVPPSLETSPPSTVYHSAAGSTSHSSIPSSNLSSPDPNDIPGPQAISGPSVGRLGVTIPPGTQSNPINVDDIPDDIHIRQPDTPTPTMGILDRSTTRFRLRCLYCRGFTIHPFGECTRQRDPWQLPCEYCGDQLCGNFECTNF